MEGVKQFLRRLGPGLITASLVLGPGSISAASNAGATVGYSLLWVLVLAGLFMATFTAMGARLGCAIEETPLQFIRREYGRWLAVLTGISGFLICGGFQFGNNLGVADAMYGLTGLPKWISPVLFTALAIAFLFGAKHLYRMLERFMMLLVAIMIIAFAANLFWTGIDIPAMLAGLVPRSNQFTDMSSLAMTATTFSIIAAFYQAYLVKAKGWRREDIGDAIKDAWVGIAILTGITAVVMFGAAQTLGGHPIKNIGELAQQLRGFLGPMANLVFCLGLAAAAFSSFIVNAMVGGNLLADGLGLDPRVNSTPTKALTTVVMLLGCTVAIITSYSAKASLPSLLVAQASTLIAAPLSGILLFIITSNRRIMGNLRNRAAAKLIGVAGLFVVLAMMYRTLSGLVAQLFG